MIRNIITIAVRVLIRNKFFSLINILGISLGLSCSLLIFASVRDQLSYDRFHKEKDHLFIIQQFMNLGTGPYRTDRCGGAVGPALQDAFPEVLSSVRYSEPKEFLMIHEQGDSAGIPRRKRFIENNVLAVDSNFLDVFTFQVVMGDARTALEDPWSIILTKKSSEKYFSKEDPIGKIISLNSEYPFTITAVVDDPPANSSIQFDYLVNFVFLEELGHELDGYNGNPYYTWLYLEDPDKADELGQRISEFLGEYQSDILPADQSLISLSDFHQKGEAKGDIFITIMIFLAITILAIACINFMNLTTARYLQRTREVGVRKVVGANRPQLIRQFIGETMILVFIALNISILTIDSLLPVFNHNFETSIDFRLSDPVILAGILAIFLITSIVAGSYPAFFLSSLKTISVFSKFRGSRRKGGGIRKVLVIVQFLFTIIFIIATIANYRQFRLLKETGMEFNTENIIYLPVRGDLFTHLPEFKQEIMLNPSVESVTGAAYVPRYVDRGELSWGLAAEDDNDIALLYPVGYDFDKTFNVELEEGRFYDKRMPGDTGGTIIINRSVADALELKEPIGKTFYLNEKAFIIIGVIKNYVFNPLSLGGDKVILPFENENPLVFVKTNSSDKPGITKYIESLHEKFNPDFPFTPLYLDEYMDPITEALGDFNKIIYFFTLFGILISCMGLLGLSIFTTEQRTKEIGIRKSMGASSEQILRLVAIDFLKLIFISLLLAIPISILLLRMLLNLFAERINLGPGLFLVTTLVVVMIAMLTISFQAIRSARSNPATSLRYE